MQKNESGKWDEGKAGRKKYSG